MKNKIVLLVICLALFGTFNTKAQSTCATAVIDTMKTSFQPRSQQINSDSIFYMKFTATSVKCLIGLRSIQGQTPPEITQLTLYSGACNNLSALTSKVFTSQDSLFLIYDGLTIGSDYYLKISNSNITDTCYFKLGLRSGTILSQPTNYTCDELVLCYNQVDDWDFSLGGPPFFFSSNLTYNGTWFPYNQYDRYNVVDEASDARNSWTGYGVDNGGGPDNFFIADGFTLGLGYDIAWSENVTVTAGTTYYFSFFVRDVNIELQFVQPNIQFWINGNAVNINSVGSTSFEVPFDNISPWKQLCGEWTAPGSGTYIVPIAIMDINDYNHIGNDFGLDDIVFAAVASAGDDVTICAGNSATLTASCGDAYLWNPGAYTTQSITVSPSATTTYTVTIYGPNGNSMTDVVTVTVNPLPYVYATPNNNFICPGQSVSLSAYGALNYIWSPAAGLTCTSCSNPTASPTVTTTYTVAGTDINGCIGTADLLITVYTPQANFTFETACVGQPVAFYDLSSCAQSWQWDFGDGTSSTLQNPIHTYASVGTYNVILVITDYTGATYSYHNNIIVYPLPDVPNINGLVNNNCPPINGQNLYFEINPVQTGVSYSWAFTAGTGTIAVGTLSTTATVTFTPPGTPYAWSPAVIEVTATDDKTGCTSTGYLYLYPCCDLKLLDPQPPINTIYIFNTDALSLPQSNYSNETFVVNGTFTIDKNMTFTKCTFYMGQKAEIYVKSNYTLDIENSSILQAGCDIMWKGITLEDLNAKLVIHGAPGTPLIKDAMSAVTSNKGGVFDIFNSTFNLNYKDIVVNEYPDLHPGKVSNTEFICNGVLMDQDPTVIATRTSIGIEINNVGNPNYPATGITIGDNTMAANKNVFINMDYGIRSYRSNVTVLNNEFRQITKVSTLNPQAAIYATGYPLFLYWNKITYLTVGGTGPNDKNLFRNCTNNTGIYSEWNIDLSIANNEFNAAPPLNGMATGIYYTGNNFFNKVLISNNKFNYTKTGIYSYANSQCSSVIQGNTYNVTSSGGIGILAYGFGSNNEQMQIDNQNKINNATKGIWLINLVKANVTDNTITLGTTPSVTGIRGIYAQNCTGAQIISNTITGTSSALGYGISLELSPGTLAKCNEIKKVNYAMHFGGAMPSAIIANRMKNNNYGLYLYNGGIIGPQGSTTDPSDNKWTGNNFATWTYDSFGSLSKLFVRNTGQYDPVISIVHYTGSGDAFTKDNTGTGAIQACDVFVPPHSANKKMLLQQLAKNQITFPANDIEAKWLGKKAVYEIYKQDSTLASDTLLTQFNDSTTLSPMGKLNDAQNALFSMNVATAQALNNAAIPVNVIESNEKAVNDILIQNMLDSTILLNSQQLLYLQTLAAECPYTSGTAVYRARVLIAPYDTTEYINICEMTVNNGNNKNIESITEDKEEIIRVFPNPANSELFIEINSEFYENASLSIFDYTGKIVMQIELIDNLNKLDISSLSSGLFLYRICNNDALLRTDKFVIIK